MTERTTVQKILIIEEDDDLVLALRASLEAHGFATEQAATAQEGIDQALRVQPDAAILAVKLPGGYSGFEVARMLREYHGFQELPIVMLASLDQKQKAPHHCPDKTDLLVNAFLDKSADLEQMTALVKELLGERRSDPLRGG